MFIKAQPYYILLCMEYFIRPGKWTFIKQLFKLIFFGYLQLSQQPFVTFLHSDRQSCVHKMYQLSYNKSFEEKNIIVIKYPKNFVPKRKMCQEFHLYPKKIRFIYRLVILFYFFSIWVHVLGISLIVPNRNGTYMPSKMKNGLKNSAATSVLDPWKIRPIKGKLNNQKKS